MGDLLLGIDLGTTTCRCVLFDLEGREVSSAAEELALRYPRPRWAEANPDTWWAAVARVVRAALERGAIAPKRVVGIGLSGLMHAPVLVDANGAVVAPAVPWMDQRCAPQCAALNREAAAAGIEVGFAFAPTHTTPKLRWLADEAPEALARAQRLLLPKDFIRLRLTGVACTDTSDAGGTGLYDRAGAGAAGPDEGWRWELVDLARAPRRLLPEVRPAWALAGRVTPEAAAQTGLVAGTPVAVGGADTLCTRLGAGKLEPGEVCLYLGTAAWIAVMAGVAPDGRQVVSGFGSTATTGAALRWARDLLLPAGTADTETPVAPAGGQVGGQAGGEDPWAGYETLTREAAQVPPGVEGLFFLPHLMGERGPVADPLACGALVGLTLRHRRPHVARAVVEGTVYQLRRVLEARAAPGEGKEDLTPNPSPTGVGSRPGRCLGDAPTGQPRSGIACGGAARSALWMQVLADVTRLALRVPETAECGALGAAILGGAAVGLFTVDEGQSRLARAGRAGCASKFREALGGAAECWRVE